MAVSHKAIPRYLTQVFSTIYAMQIPDGSYMPCLLKRFK